MRMIYFFVVFILFFLAALSSCSEKQMIDWNSADYGVPQRDSGQLMNQNEGR